MYFGGNKNRRVLVSWTFLFSVLSQPCFGEGGSDVLLGLANVISAASPAVTAGIQAGADVSIAKTNSQTAIKTSQIQADVSKYQADSNERISAIQSGAAMAINAENNAAQTQRLGMMLAQQAADREMKYALQADQRRYEYNLKRQELAFAEIQRQQNYKLELMKMEAEKVKAGLSTGFTPVKSGLTTNTNLGAANSVGSQIANAASGRSRLFRSTRGVRVSDKLTSFGMAAQGSTRAFRQKGVSDLSSFTASVGRSIASEEGLRRHKMPEDYARNTDAPSHR